MRLLEQLLNTRHGSVENLVDAFRAFVFVGPVFRDLEDARLRQIQQFVAITPLWIVTGVRNFMRHRDHIADHGAFAHNVRISTDIRRAWRVFRQLRQIGETADAVQLALPLQRFRERNQVDRTAAFLQAPHLRKDMAMRAGIEIFRHHALGHIVPALVIQH
ncbi:hypothetical protein NGUA15_00763 [Salmonella enterica]|nr:hypothetical protein NGUA15_00763 [Salmonella enterica]